MKTKVFELRDRATNISIVCISPKEGTDIRQQHSVTEQYIWGRAGFTGVSEEVIMIELSRNECQVDPYGWRNERTMRTAHNYIRDNWEKLQSGQVIDIRFILGEEPEPAKSDYYWVAP